MMASLSSTKTWLTFGFVLFDLCFSYCQFYNTPIDGDFVGGVYPEEAVALILNDMFGLSAVTGENYPNPNRYFSHYLFYTYFNSVPFLLQKIVAPIESLFHAAALFKVVVQAGLLYTISVLASGKLRIWHGSALFTMILVTPLFQYHGYRSYMGVIDQSITYNFFYAFPLLLLLIYLTPFYLLYNYGLRSTWLKAVKILSVPLALVIGLSGPLNPAVILVVACSLMLLHFSTMLIGRNASGGRRLFSTDYIYLLPLLLVSLYSLWLGTHNSITIANAKPLFELYKQLPAGLLDTLTAKIGYPLLVVATVLNVIIIKYRTIQGDSKILGFAQGVLLFSILYILLLPLGGYREYRPLIIRYDTILPITIAMMVLFARSSLLLYKQLPSSELKIYLPTLLVIAAVFWNADTLELEADDCQRKNLELLSSSQEEVVQLPNDCLVLSWQPITQPSQSQLNAKFLAKWNVTEQVRLYRQ